MFKVGAFYKMKDDPPQNMPHHYFSEKGMVLECIRALGRRYGIMAGAQRTWHIAWVDLVPSPGCAPKVLEPSCKCNLFISGCICGEMTKAMAARNLVKCQYTNLWIKKQ